ncbi:hypothetical protein TCAL_00420 [Tigriopus californicus]|uniref:Uncharacterized protein n=2 Tax=Tigriopus californicus TaxID=6832 RepID=A0A553NDE6_TIGCA|nr:hypothetical protein TCAL_00420 [Tigriopus californicus]|eukprot:TCALIF_00420-PA protein Name:"Protein of unknown function" AED:0.28 eAED:0.36 QI:0/-1/0/1/-1/1/1/0/242
MRITPTKILNAIIVMILLSLGVLIFQNSPNVTPEGSPFRQTCHMSQMFQTNLQNLVHLSHKILETLNLRHFLCYSSLFGQIRSSSILPWEKKAKLCVINEEIAKYDELFLRRRFASSGLNLEYNSSDGKYTVTVDDRSTGGTNSTFDADFHGELHLIVFALDKDIRSSEERMYHRIGWQRRILPPDCDFSTTLECFPERLAHEPLPLKLFGDDTVPVPREGFELLKHHYPENWWREVKPLNC